MSSDYSWVPKLMKICKLNYISTVEYNELVVHPLSSFILFNSFLHFISLFLSFIHFFILFHSFLTFYFLFSFDSHSRFASFITRFCAVYRMFIRVSINHPHISQ